MSEEKVQRRMTYPYTFSARFAQFPLKYYYNNSWVFRYMIFGSILTLPVFYKIQKMSYSEENVRKWAEIEKRELSGEMQHH